MTTFESACNDWRIAKDIDEELGTAETRAAVLNAQQRLQNHTAVVRARGQLENAENMRRHHAQQIPNSNG